MSSKPFLFLAVALAVALSASDASAQRTSAFAPEPEQPAYEHDIVRLDLGLQVVNRTFDLRGPTDVLFDAPFYTGLRVGVELFPVALFDRESPAAGLGFQLRTAKHVLNTVAAYEIDGEPVDFDVPTRHDVTTLALIYEWRVTDALQITPGVGLHTVEYSLGYNVLFRNSFYRSAEIGARLDYDVGPEGLSLGAGVRIRPAVDLGSTVRPFGSTSSSFGIAIEAGMRYVSPIGLYGVAQFQYDRYATTYRPDRNEDRGDSRATDQYRGLVFAMGYAY
jgi:hypothetical protein